MQAPTCQVEGQTQSHFKAQLANLWHAAGLSFTYFVSFYLVSSYLVLHTHTHICVFMYISFISRLRCNIARQRATRSTLHTVLDKRTCVLHASGSGSEGHTGDLLGRPSRPRWTARCVWGYYLQIDNSNNRYISTLQM